MPHGCPIDGGPGSRSGMVRRMVDPPKGFLGNCTVRKEMEQPSRVKINENTAPPALHDARRGGILSRSHSRR